MYTIDELVHEIGLANAENDLEKLTELEQCFKILDKPGPLPLAPCVALDEAHVEAADDELESDRVLGLANAVSRARRRITYFRSKWSGIRPPVIVSEGDSWFQYPIRLHDVIDVVMEHYQLLSLGAAGDLLVDMYSHGEYLNAIEREQADAFLLSGGGNDMLHGGRLREFLRPYQAGMDPRDLLDPQPWNAFRMQIEGTYRNIFDSLVYRFPQLRILCHGYDYALPRDGGPWLGQPLADRNVPRDLWNDVVRVLIDEFNSIISRLAEDYYHRVFHVDCRTTVGGTLNSWHDELHPKDTGYRRAAEKFIEILQQNVPPAESLISSWGRPVAFTTTEAIASSAAAPPAPRPPLPSIVTQQLLHRSSQATNPEISIATRDDASMELDEAIIDQGRADVGPRLRPAPGVAPTRRGESTQAPGTASPNTSFVVRAVIDQVMDSGELPQPAVPSDAGWRSCSRCRTTETASLFYIARLASSSAQ